MSETLKSLQKNQQNIKYAVFGPSGYTFYMKESSVGTTSRLSGYGSLDAESRKFIEESKIPTVNHANVSNENRVKMAMSLPLISDDMREGPVNGMSKASFEVYANLAKLKGSEVINVRDIKLIPEMFSSISEADKKLLTSIALGTATEENVADRMMQDLKNPKKEDSLWKPLSSTKETESFSRYLDKILDKTLQELVSKKNELEDQRKNMNFEDAGYNEVLSNYYGIVNAIKNVKEIANFVTWNALMVQAGNLSESEAWKEAGASVKGKHLELIEVNKQYSIETHGHLHKSLDILKKVFSGFSKVADKSATIDSEMSL